MCTFENERTVLVCDVAIGQVKRDLEHVFAGRIRYTSIDGKGTLVEADPQIDGSAFTDVTRAAIQALPNG